MPTKNNGLQYIGDIYYASEKVSWGKGVVANKTVYLSGVDGVDPITATFPPDVESQTMLALDKAKERLEQAGSDINHIVRFVVYVVGRENLENYRKARGTWFEKHGYAYSPPIFASTILLVAGLARPQMLVEIDITAVQVDKRERKRTRKKK